MTMDDKPSELYEEIRKRLEARHPGTSAVVKYGDRVIVVDTGALGRNLFGAIIDDASFDMKDILDRPVRFDVTRPDLMRSHVACEGPGCRFCRGPDPTSPTFPTLNKKERQAQKAREKTHENVRRRPPRRI
jgi:hypothetical protein